MQPTSGKSPSVAPAAMLFFSCLYFWGVKFDLFILFPALIEM